MKTNLILILTFLATSCTNSSFNQISADVQVNVEANLEADIKVGEKIIGTGSESVFLWFFRLPGVRHRASSHSTSLTSSSPSVTNIPMVNTFGFLNQFNIIENAKGEAVHDAITTSKADIIINPKFEITETDYFFFKTVKCKVTGLKGTITKVQ